MPKLLLCANCGGPLPRPLELSPYVTCLYCQATSNLLDATLRLAAPGDAQQSKPGDRDPYDVSREAVNGLRSALEALTGSASITYAALDELARVHLQVLGQTESVARVAYNLADDFARESGLPVLSDGTALFRFVQGYMLAVEELRRQREYELNLPFLLVGSDGPKHYLRKLSVPLLLALAEREPRATEVVAEAAAEPSPKRGFFAKLFGG